MENLADLDFLIGYASAVRSELLKGEQPTMLFVNSMADLADKVQRSLDSNYEEWCNAEARRGNGS